MPPLDPSVYKGGKGLRLRSQPRRRGIPFPSGPLVPAAFTTTDPKYLAVDGQSLAVGTAGSPALTTVNPFGAPIPESADDFLALVEATVERPVSGGVYQVRDNDSARLYLSGTQGIAGAKIADLRAPSVHWTNVQNKMDSVAIQESEATLPTVWWIQGHADADSAVGFMSAQLALLQAEYTAEAQARFSNQGARQVVIVIAQNGNATQVLTDVDFSEVPYEQWAAYEADPAKFIIAGPTYQFGVSAVTYVFGDGVHLTNEGYLRMSELLGQATSDTFVDDVLWVPVHIVSAVYDAPNVILTYSEPIDIDTTAVIAAPSHGGVLHGIYMEDVGPNPEVLISASKTGPSEITCVASGQPHEGAMIATGRQSRRGAFNGPGIAAASWGSMRTNIRATTNGGTGSESGDAIAKWAVLEREAIANTVAVSATDGTSVTDRRWTHLFLAEDSSPASAGTWTDSVGGIVAPNSAGTHVGNQSTTGLTPAALGASLVDEGFVGDSAWNITDVTDRATFDVAAGESWLWRFVGDIS